MYGKRETAGGMTIEPPTPPETPAARLRRLRRTAGLSQRQLADAIGCPQSVIARAERGGTPRPSAAAKIAGFFGLTAPELWPD